MLHHIASLQYTPVFRNCLTFKKHLHHRGVGTNLEVVRRGRGSGGVTPSGDPRGRVPGGVQGAKPPGSQRFKKI